MTDESPESRDAITPGADEPDVDALEPDGTATPDNPTDDAAE